MNINMPNSNVSNLPNVANAKHGEFYFDQKSNQVFIYNESNNYWSAILPNVKITLKDVKNPSRDHIIEALLNDPLELIYVVDPDEEMCMIALERCPQLLNIIKNQTETMIKFVLKEDPECYIYINKEKFPDLWKYGKLKCV